MDAAANHSAGRPGRSASLFALLFFITVIVAACGGADSDSPAQGRPGGNDRPAVEIPGATPQAETSASDAVESRTPAGQASVDPTLAALAADLSAFVPIADPGITSAGLAVYTRGRALLVQRRSEIRTLTEARGVQTIRSPTIAPDGTAVAYARWTLSPPPQSPAASAGADIHVVSFNGEDRVVLEHRAEGELYWQPRWTPDGTGLIYAHQKRTATDGGVMATVTIERIDLATGAVQVVRQNAAEPDLAPDQQSVIFIADPLTAPRLTIRDLTNQDERALLPADASLVGLRLPRFSPDGKWIAFLASFVPESASAAAATQRLVGVGRNGAQDLWLIRPDGRDLRRLTELNEDSPDFDWSRDGGKILLRGLRATYLVDVNDGQFVETGPGQLHGWHSWLSEPPLPR